VASVGFFFAKAFEILQLLHCTTRQTPQIKPFGFGKKIARLLETSHFSLQ